MMLKLYHFENEIDWDACFKTTVLGHLSPIERVTDRDKDTDTDITDL